LKFKSAGSEEHKENENVKVLFKNYASKGTSEINSPPLTDEKPKKFFSLERKLTTTEQVIIYLKLEKAFSQFHSLSKV
jgi:hypothetical protein